jgi:hypothetical protein
MKKYLQLLLLLVLIIPSTVFASWWNPFSWFKKEIKVEQVQIPVKQEVAPVSETKNSDNKKEIAKPETKKVITEKNVIPVKTEQPVITVKENYKIEDVVKEWRPYVASIICITTDSQGIKKSYTLGSGLLSNDPVKGPSILTARHLFNLKDGTLTNYCEVQFPDNKSEVIKIEKKDRYVSNKGFDKGVLVITQPSEYIKNLIKNSETISRDCKNTKPDSTDDIIIMGYPFDKSRDDISYSIGKIVGYKNNYFVSSATLVEGYSGGVPVSLKDNCYLGIPSYITQADPTKSYIFDINKF